MELKNWRLIGENVDIPASVPGDIIADHYKAGLIEDPFFGLNHKNLETVTRKDFTYVVDFDYEEEISSEETVELNFEGIDLFAEIYLNGSFLGKTENMFLAYTYPVEKLLKKTH